MEVGEMKIETYTCDICGKLRGEGNHWFTAYEYSSEPTSVQFGVWGEFSLHICGSECAVKLLQRNIERLQGISEDAHVA